MSMAACAALVARADPHRFRAAMAAPVAARPVLFALYAFNVEISRAPWVTAEPMIAEMRLQWWRDALDEIAKGGPVRKHEVVDALAAILDRQAAADLDALVAARRWDCYRDAFADRTALDAYLDATSGNLMWTAARLLGSAPEAAVRDLAYAAGVANLLQAAPELDARGRKPLVDGTPQGVAALAADGLERLAAAQAARKAVTAAARPALLAAHGSGAILRKACRMPQAVARGNLAPSPLRLRLALLRSALLGTPG